MINYISDFKLILRNTVQCKPQPCIAPTEIKEDGPVGAFSFVEDGTKDSNTSFKSGTFTKKTVEDEM